MKTQYIILFLTIMVLGVNAQNYKVIKEEKNLYSSILLNNYKKKHIKPKTSNPKVSTNEIDSLVLVTLYNKTGGSNWDNNDNWLTDSVYKWNGITIDNTGHVTEIDLGNNNLIDTIPKELGTLSTLTNLSLRNNNLVDSIPKELGNLSQLTALDLYYNKIRGDIPKELGNLTNLTSLNLSFNSIRGTIPKELGNLISLTSLYLDGNMLGGNIPKELGNLSNLKYLFFWGNYLNGEIPAELGNLSNIEVLDFHGNRLSGELPIELGNLTTLKTLSVSGNYLSGEIPSEFGSLTNLWYLYLSDNNFSGLPDLSGTSLNHFKISNNMFHFGDFQATGLNFSAISDLEYSPQAKVDLTVSETGGQVTLSPNVGGTGNTYKWFNDENEIIGEVSSTYTFVNTEVGIYYCKISNPDFPDLIIISQAEPYNVATSHGITEAEYNTLVKLYNSTEGPNWYHNTNWLSIEPANDWYGITVSNYHITNISLIVNGLNGTIPNELWDLSNLKSLDFWGNFLSGEIPAEIGNLTKLTYLELGANYFSGEIPKELGNLINLKQLSLYDNKFTGNIPKELGNITNLKWMMISTNKLTGSIPTEFNNLSNLEYLDIADNNFSNLPNLSVLTNLSTLKLNYNNFQFEDFENTGLNFSAISDLEYSPQAHVDLTVSETGGQVTLSPNVGGTGNTYKWFKDNVEISGETNSSLTILESDTEMFYCEIRNPNYSDLVLSSISIKLSHGIVENEYNSLIELYNSTVGTNWTDNTNWLTTENVESWKGLTVIDSHVKEIDLHNNNLIGTIPEELCNLTKLNSLNLNSNQLTALADLSSLDNLNLLDISNNIFDFEDIVPNISVASSSFVYAPQAKIGTEQEYNLSEGEDKILSITTGGINNTYKWYKDGEIISGATNSTYEITNFLENDDAGVYVCKINNTLATDLELVSNNITISKATSEEINSHDFSISVYPNPVSKILNIKVDNNIYNMELINLSGKVLIKKQNIVKDEAINLFNLKNGIYFLKIKNNKKVYIYKIIKQ